MALEGHKNGSSLPEDLDPFIMDFGLDVEMNTYGNMIQFLLDPFFFQALGDGLEEEQRSLPETARICSVCQTEAAYSGLLAKSDLATPRTRRGSDSRSD